MARLVVDIICGIQSNLISGFKVSGFKQVIRSLTVSSARDGSMSLFWPMDRSDRNKDGPTKGYPNGRYQ